MGGKCIREKEPTQNRDKHSMIRRGMVVRGKCHGGKRGNHVRIHQDWWLKALRCRAPGLVGVRVLCWRGPLGCPIALSSLFTVLHKEGCKFR